jgi:capsular exopolysaccharide synthesis family protein
MENTNNTPHNVMGRFTHLTDYYYLLRKRLWLILSILLVAVLSTAFIAFSMRPVYLATAKLIIGKESRRSPLTGRLLDYDSYISEHLTFQTHYKLATSRPVLEQVLAQVDLAGEPLEQLSLFRFFRKVQSNATRLITGIFSSSPTENLARSEERIDAEKFWRLRSKISVREIKDTRLLNIHVEDHSPRVARDIANALAENYIKYDSSTRLESSRKMLEWLNKQLYNMRKSVENAEKAFLAFKEQANLFSIEGKQRLNVQKIEDMNASYLDVRSQRLTVEAKIHELKKFIHGSRDSDIRNIPTFIENNIVENLYAKLLTTEIEHQRIARVFKHKHPEMIRITTKMAELRRKIVEQIRKSLDNAESERAVLIAREKALQGAMGSYEKDAIDTNRNELQYAILEREVEANREIYNALLAKIKETDMTDEITKTNLRLVEPANLPVTPVRPKKARNIMMSVIFGLCAGAGLTLLLEHLDQTIHNAEELERCIGLPLLSEIPKTAGNTPASKQADEPDSITVLTQPLNSRFCEAFKTLATNLRFTDLNRGGVFLVTSGAPKEGKSTTSLNLGITMAQLGRKTLLIDADLRLPVSKKIFGDAIEGGLTDILVETFNTPINNGTLGELGSGDIHKLLEIQEKSGVLRYENQNEVFTVSFHKGQIINVDWTSRPATTRLGSLLVRCDKITKDQAQIALAKRETTSQRLGQVLLHLGFLTPEELAGPLKIHLSENIRALNMCQNTACRNASFTFEEDHSPASLTLDAKEAALQQSMGQLNGVSAFPTPFLHNQIKNRLCKVDGSDLWLLPSVDLLPNPTELLAGNRMRILLELLREQFDLIFIDTPPVATLSDAAVLASLADGVIMVIKAGDTDLKLVRRSLEQLDAVEAKVTGIVLNMLDEKKDPYYYGRYASRYKEYYQGHGEERE